jgi:UDP-N-acetyl-alpha-D-muramoyl-L-alanyl-L-glutamate epimerase
MPLQAADVDRFRYDGYELEPARSRLTCRYSSGGRHFTERVTFDAGGDWAQPAVDAAARLVFLLAGVSYYKTTAAPVIDLGDLATTEAERTFLRAFTVEGLGEFAFRNGLDLSGLEVTGPTSTGPTSTGSASTGTASTGTAPAPFEPKADHPLVPFGGGIDSIVTVEHVRAAHPDTSLFVVSRPDDRFDAIERAATVTGLPVVRAGREIDPQLLRSAALGFLNGHVPVTGILSTIAVMAAVLGGHDAVVMSNERSASAATVVVDGRPVNHQWSKSLAFEAAFRDQLARSLDGGPAYFSLLRACSELWVARRFADLPIYHAAFRSCNRAFTLDRDRRAAEWCGTCDKCCFIDLVLAPFLAADELSAVFGGREPLRDAALTDRFRALVGSGPDAKPFECVGDVDECRAAVQLAAARPDRAGTSVLRTLVTEVDAGGTDTGGTGDATAGAGALLRPAGPHHVPDGYRLDPAGDGPTPADEPATA